MPSAPSNLEAALLTAIEQARAGQQTEMAVSLSMMLESLRRQNEGLETTSVAFTASRLRA